MPEMSDYTTVRAFECDGVPVINLTMTLPKLAEGGAAARRINAFYVHTARAIEKHVKKKLLPLAAGDFTEAIANSRPFEPYRVKITFETAIPVQQGFEIRRRIYARLRGGAERDRILTERWNMKLGLPDKLLSEAADYTNLEL